MHMRLPAEWEARERELEREKKLAYDQRNFHRKVPTTLIIAGDVQLGTKGHRTGKLRTAKDGSASYASSSVGSRSGRDTAVGAAARPVPPSRPRDERVSPRAAAASPLSPGFAAGFDPAPPPPRRSSPGPRSRGLHRESSIAEVDEEALRSSRGAAGLAARRSYLGASSGRAPGSLREAAARSLASEASAASQYSEPQLPRYDEPELPRAHARQRSVDSEDAMARDGETGERRAVAIAAVAAAAAEPAGDDDEQDAVGADAADDGTPVWELAPKAPVPMRHADARSNVLGGAQGDDLQGWRAREHSAGAAARPGTRIGGERQVREEGFADGGASASVRENADADADTQEGSVSGEREHEAAYPAEVASERSYEQQLAEHGYEGAQPGGAQPSQDAHELATAAAAYEFDPGARSECAPEDGGADSSERAYGEEGEHAEPASPGVDRAERTSDEERFERALAEEQGSELDTEQQQWQSSPPKQPSGRRHDDEVASNRRGDQHEPLERGLDDDYHSERAAEGGPTEDASEGGRSEDGRSEGGRSEDRRSEDGHHGRGAAASGATEEEDVRSMYRRPEDQQDHGAAHAVAHTGDEPHGAERVLQVWDEEGDTDEDDEAAAAARFAERTPGPLSDNDAYSSDGDHDDSMVAATGDPRLNAHTAEGNADGDGDDAFVFATRAAGDGGAPKTRPASRTKPARRGGDGRGGGGVELVATPPNSTPPRSARSTYSTRSARSTVSEVEVVDPDSQAKGKHSPIMCC
eukprot:353827-Chlamydomonas_euryale.AAC.4